MDVSIEKNIATFTLTGLPQTTRFPIVFNDAATATRERAPAIASILTLKAIQQIEIGPRGDVDYIKITMQEGVDWHGKQDPRSDKTRADIITGALNMRLYSDKRIPLLMIPSYDYYKPDFIQRIQEKLNEMGKKGIIQTDEHGGGVRALHYSPNERSLTYAFEGVCATSCVASSAATASIIKNYLCTAFPGAFDPQNIKPVVAPS